MKNILERYERHVHAAQPDGADNESQVLHAWKHNFYWYLNMLTYTTQTVSTHYIFLHAYIVLMERWKPGRNVETSYFSRFIGKEITIISLIVTIIIKILNCGCYRVVAWRSQLRLIRFAITIWCGCRKWDVAVALHDAICILKHWLCQF